MMKISVFRFGILLMVFSVLCPYISLADENDLRFSKQVNFDFCDEVCGEYKNDHEIDFLIKGNHLYVDAEEFLKQLGFEALVKNDNEFNFFSKGVIDKNKKDIYDFSRMDVNGTYLLDSDDVFYSIFKAKAVEIKAPVKSFYKYNKAWIPFSFTLELLNLDFDESKLEDTFYIKRKPVERMDVMLANKYILESPKTFKWDDIYGDNTDDLLKKAKLLVTVDRIMSKDFIDAVSWDKAGVRDALKSMILFKEMAKIDDAKIELKADSFEYTSKLLESVRYYKGDNPIANTIKAYFDYGEKQGATKEKINLATSNLATYYRLIGLYHTELKNINSDLSKAFASYYQDKIARDKGVSKNNLDEMALGILKSKFIPDTVIDRIPDLITIFSNDRTLSKGVDFSPISVADCIELEHATVKLLFKDVFDSAEAFQTGTCSNLLSENIRLDFLNNLYRFDAADIRESDILNLDNTFYLALIGKYTTNNNILDTLNIVWGSNPKGRQIVRDLKSTYEEENIKILKAIDDFEKAKKYDKASKYYFDKSMINLEYNKEYIENYDDSNLVRKIREYNDLHKAIDVKVDFTSEIIDGSTYEVMILNGVDEDGDTVWTKHVKGPMGQMTVLKFLFVDGDYFYYKSYESVVKANISDGSTVWENSDGAAIIDWVLGKDGTLYMTMGISPKFQAIDKDGKTIKVIDKLEGDLPYYELGKINLQGKKLYIEIFMGDTVPGENEHYLEMYISDFSYILPELEGDYQSSDGNTDYEDIISGYDPSQYSYFGYALVDIDGDGGDELIVHTGTCEADRKYIFYTIKDGNSIYLDEINAWHSALYMGEKGLIHVSGEGEMRDYFSITINKEEERIEKGPVESFNRNFIDPDFGEGVNF